MRLNSQAESKRKDDEWQETETYATATGTKMKNKTRIWNQK